MNVDPLPQALGGKQMRNEFTAVLEQDQGWYIAYCLEIPGANGQGRSRERCLSSLAEATALILQNRREDALRGIPKDEIYKVVVTDTDMEDPDPESLQIKEVFTYFGNALFHAQGVERQLAILLATKYGPGPERITKTQYDELLESLFEKTLGSLVGELRKTVSVPQDLESILVETRNRRNWLAHNYFWERAIHFMTEQGRTSMIHELQDCADFFTGVDEQLTEITKEWAVQYGVTEEALQLELEELLRQESHGDKR